MVLRLYFVGTRYVRVVRRNDIYRLSIIDLEII